MIEINGTKIYREQDLNEWDQKTKMELLRYFFSTPVEKRQDKFLVYSPKALRFWVVPIKENAEDNLKMFENGISLRKYLEGAKDDEETET